MNKNQLYDIESALYRKLDTIKMEQKQYNAGIEKGIDMTVSEVKRGLEKESQQSGIDCIYCCFENDVGADFPEPDKFNLVRGNNDNGKYNYSIVTDKNKIFRACKIRFCPMCGRLLESGEEAE